MILDKFFKLDVAGAITQGLFAIIFIFFFLDLFDTVFVLRYAVPGLH